jgi:hypothetical protein
MNCPYTLRYNFVPHLSGNRYNPRQQYWKDHFSWNADGTEIVALTACGRATVKALRLNNSLAVTVRKNWVQAGWHPPN